MSIDQTTQRMAVEWQTFSIGKDSTVTFNQPSSNAVALNRVVGSDVSTIQGALRANGQVFLVNPNGVLFTPSAQVDVNGLVASTLGLSNEDFLAGNYRFSGDSTAKVDNQGTIRAAEGGYVALVAARIVNTGNIEARKGDVLMGAGRRVTLDLGGPTKLEVEQAALDALIEQGGAIRADGGTVLLTARAAGELARTVINHTGVIEAQGLTTGQGGVIRLLAGTDNGRVQVAGTLTATSAAGVGGRVEVTGKDVAIGEGAALDASGAGGGGEVLVGGSYQNQDPGVAQATSVSIAESATLRADATAHGNGGTVVAWADITNQQSSADVKGTLSARGGANGGNGGRVETSAATVNIADDVRVDTSAAQGVTGDWLIDPNDYTIAAAGGNITGAALATSLNTTNVTIQTVTQGTPLQNGDIFVNDTVTKNSANNTTLTLLAERNIEINAPVSNSGGGRLNVVLTADSDNNSSGSVLFSGTGSIDTRNGNFYVGNASGGDSVTARGQNLTMANGSFVNAGSGTVDIRVTGNISLDAQSLRTSTRGSRYYNNGSQPGSASYMWLETPTTGSIVSTNAVATTNDILSGTDITLVSGTIGTSGNRVKMQGAPSASTSNSLSITNYGTGGTYLAEINKQLFSNLTLSVNGVTSGTQDLRIMNGLGQLVGQTDGAGTLSIASGGVNTSTSIGNVTINAPTMVLENGAVNTGGRTFTANFTSITAAAGSNADGLTEINSTQQINLTGTTVGTIANPVELSGTGSTLQITNTMGSTYVKSVDAGQGGASNIIFGLGRTAGHHEVLFAGGDHINFDTTVTGTVVPTIGSSRSDGFTFNQTNVSGIDLTGGNRDFTFMQHLGGIELDDTSVNLGRGKFTAVIGANNGDGPGSYIRSVRDYDALSRVPQITAGDVTFVVYPTTAGAGVIGGGGKDIQIAQGAGASANTLTIDTQRGDVNIHELTENHFKSLSVTLNQTSAAQTVAIDLAGPDDVNFADDGSRITLDGTKVNLSSNNRNWFLSAPVRTIQIDGTSLSSGSYTVQTTDCCTGAGIFLNGDILTDGGNITLDGSSSTGKGIKMMRPVRIDSNADDLSNSASTGGSGSITLRGPLSSTGGANTLTVDSSSSTDPGGFIDVYNNAGNFGGAYLTGITLTSKGSTTTNDGGITLRGDDYSLNGDFLATGNTSFYSFGSMRIDTEQGNVGSAGKIAFSGYNLSNSYPYNDLTFDTSTTAVGANAGSIDLAGTVARGALGAQSITAKATGGAGGTAGNIDVAATATTYIWGSTNSQNYTGNVITLYGDLASQRGNITFNGDVRLANDVTISTWEPHSTGTYQSATAGSVTFNGTGVSATAAGRALTINTGTDTGGGYFNPPTNTQNWTHSGGAVTVSTGNAGGHYLQSLNVITTPAGTRNVGATAGAITLNGVATTGNATFAGGATSIAGNLLTNGGNIDLSGVQSLTLTNGPILIDTDMAGGSNAAGIPESRLTGAEWRACADHRHDG